MWQELIITDLTQMRGGKVCIAGLTHQGIVIRPELPDGIHEHHLFANERVIICPRAVVQMALSPADDCEPPHVEDHDWTTPDETRFLHLASDTVWRDVLEHICYRGVSDVFEAEILENRKIAPGSGARSLGTVQPAVIDDFEYKAGRYDARWEYRLSFTDETGLGYTRLSITDLALRAYADHLRTRERLSTVKISRKILDQLKEREVWLRIGLTRPYAKDGGDEAWCYLQVNGIYTFPDYLDGRCFADFV